MHIIYYLRLFYLFLFFKIIIVRRPPSAVRRPHPPSGSAVRIRTLQSPSAQSRLGEHGPIDPCNATPTLICFPHSFDRLKVLRFRFTV